MSDNGETLRTRDHETIRRWAEERGAKPAKAKGADVIELDFPGYSGENLEEISWDEWFRVFDERDLELLYQEKTADGEQSSWHRLVEAGGS